MVYPIIYRVSTTSTTCIHSTIPTTNSYCQVPFGSLTSEIPEKTTLSLLGMVQKRWETICAVVQTCSFFFSWGMVINPLLGFNIYIYISVVRIPNMGWTTINHIRCFDHGTSILWVSSPKWVPLVTYPPKKASTPSVTKSGRNPCPGFARALRLAGESLRATASWDPWESKHRGV